MKPPPDSEALRDVALRLEELLGARATPSTAKIATTAGRADAEVHAGDRLYLVEWRASGDVAAVTAGVRELTGPEGSERGLGVPLLAVPFMGEAGRRVCSESNVSWLDLSGNARIEAPGVNVRIEGRENRFKRRGRPSNPFAPKSSRVSRWLLLHPHRFHSQQEMALETGVGPGLVSRVTRRLEELELVERNENGAVRPRDPRLLLDAWAERYDFERHHLIRGHVAARSGEELLARVSSALASSRMRHAATGLAGAWLLTHFAAFRTVTCYVSAVPGADLLESLGFHANARGSNLWLAIPRDEAVFQGSQMKDGVPCAHPIQVWLDLKGHPERASEAAQRIEETIIGGWKHA